MSRYIIEFSGTAVVNAHNEKEAESLFYSEYYEDIDYQILDTYLEDEDLEEDDDD
ncbi:MAG: hypothetical protein UDB11_00575 [Peptococcaceae bacterium]|nr:hypothetical protein [Peptococcaceae bacterium]